MSEEKRKVVDCRLYPSENRCTLSIEGTEEEVLEQQLNMLSSLTGTRTARNYANKFVV